MNTLLSRPPRRSSVRSEPSLTRKEVTKTINESLRKTRASLVDGGPDIDSLLITHYLSGKLAPENNAEVEGLVLKYKKWFDQMMKCL